MSTTSSNIEGQDQNINSSALRFDPTVGFFIAEDKSIGLLASVIHTRSKFGDNDPVKSTDFSLGGFYRQYFELDERFLTYFQGTVSYGNFENLVGTGSADSQNFGIIGNIGLVYFLSNRLAVNMTYGNIGYTYSKVTTTGTGFDQETKNNTLLIGLDLSTVGFGLEFYPGRKAE